MTSDGDDGNTYYDNNIIMKLKSMKITIIIMIVMIKMITIML